MEERGIVYPPTHPKPNPPYTPNKPKQAKDILRAAWTVFGKWGHLRLFLRNGKALRCDGFLRGQEERVKVRGSVSTYVFVFASTPSFSRLHHHHHHHLIKNPNQPQKPPQQEILKANFGMDLEREEVNPGGANFGDFVFEVRAAFFGGFVRVCVHVSWEEGKRREDDGSHWTQSITTPTRL